MSRVLVGGEALVDLVPAPDRTTSDERLAPLVPRLGGAPVNLAVALGRLGARPAMLTRLSTDPFGEALLEHLAGNGVDVSLVQRGDEHTSLAVVTLDDGAARYAFHVQGTADRLVADPGALPDDVGAVALGGLGIVLEPGASVYAALLERAGSAGRLVSLDPNIRPSLVDDADALRARLRSWLPHVGLLKLSDEDAQWWTGSSSGEQVREWLDDGVGAVVVTRGADPLSVTSRVAGHVEVPTVALADAAPDADTIGAGDTVHAAVLAWLAEQGRLSRDGVASLDADGWRAALEFAATAAAITCARPGADPPTRDALRP